VQIYRYWYWQTFHGEYIGIGWTHIFLTIVDNRFC
jgi:hypothetical protein